jgi:hypothetical protein
MRTQIPILLAAAAVVAVACSDPTGSTSTPLITASAIAGGDAQSALVGTTLPWPLQVRVRSGDVALAGAIVVWQPSSGGLTITSSATDSNGVASARWTLGNAPGPGTVVATVQGAEGSPVTFTATALGWVTATVDRATDNQSGTVGAVLPSQLRIRAVSAGAPAEGVAVTWTTNDGGFETHSTLTDINGIATAGWVLGTTAGPMFAQATIDRSQAAPLAFTATAVPGAAVRIEKLRGDGQEVPANFPEFGQLQVDATDQFGNAVPPQTIVWSVQSGPVTILTTSFGGSSIALVSPTGVPGDGVVRAAAGGALSVDFALRAAASVPFVLLDQNAGMFSSAQNGSLPAVDTIPVGGSMTWLLKGWNYLYDDQGVASVGDPSFAGGYFTSDPSTFTAVFAAPGTYRYTDAYNQAPQGTVVVK